MSTTMESKLRAEVSALASERYDALGKIERYFSFLPEEVPRSLEEEIEIFAKTLTSVRVEQERDLNLVRSLLPSNMGDETPPRSLRDREPQEGSGNE